MREDDLREILKAALPTVGGHLSWVESHETSPGFPDADWCIDGTVIQMELKVVKNKGSIIFRPTQYRWLKDRVLAGGRPVVMIGDDNGEGGFIFYVMPGRAVYQQGPIPALVNTAGLNGRTHYKTDNIFRAMEIAYSIASNTGAWKHV